MWLALKDCDTQLSKPDGRTDFKKREYCAQACEKFCKIFPLNLKKNIKRKMNLFFLHIRDKGLYYEFLCLEENGEQAHKKLNQAEHK